MLKETEDIDMEKNTHNSPKTEKGIAYCGLACCLCSHNEACPGCQAGGCDIHSWCENYRCCREQGLNGCWECDHFSCRSGMLSKARARAFVRFAREQGPKELIRCLRRNMENHILYHYEGQLTGDYDQTESEEEILAMIRWGRSQSPDDGRGDQT